MHKKKLTLMHPGAEVSRNFTDIFVMLVYTHQLLVVCSSGIRYNSCSFVCFQYCLVWLQATLSHWDP